MEEESIESKIKQKEARRKDKSLTAVDKEPRKRKPNELAQRLPSLFQRYFKQVRKQTAFDHR